MTLSNPNHLPKALLIPSHCGGGFQGMNLGRGPKIQFIILGHGCGNGGHGRQKGI